MPRSLTDSCDASIQNTYGLDWYVCAMITRFLRYLLETLEARDRIKAAAVPTAAEQSVQRVNPSAPAKPAAAASCAVVDPMDRDLAQIRAIMDEANAEVVVTNAASLPAVLTKATPNVIFISVAEGAEETVRAALARLASGEYGGAVQFVGANDRVPVEALCEAAAQQSVRTLPSLVSPVTRQAIEETVKSEGLARTPGGEIAVDLGVALRKRWIEFFYQPKISLAKRTLIGAEALARLRHPTHGVLLPSSFLPNAAVPDLASLGIEALKACFRDWTAFQRAQFNLRLAVNIPIAAIDADQIVRLIDGQQLAQNWPGLVVDIEETDIRVIKPETRDLVMRLKERGIDIAVDNVGTDPEALASVVTLPLSEIKLARSLVHGVSTSQSRQSVCRLLIDLAHHLRATTVANGIEAAADLEILRGLGCDVAQGQLLAPALPRAQFISLLMRHPPRSAPAR